MSKTKFPLFIFRVGRDYFRDRDCIIAFSAIRRKNPGLGEIAYRFNFELYWDWPRIVFIFIPRPTEKKEGV